MSVKINQFLNDITWDTPFFKRLANNDTGSAPSHQSGVFIPKSLSLYFPELDRGLTSNRSPTVDRRLTAEMFILDQPIGCANIRYQFQTWSGTRTPERRITSNLGPLLNNARGGDVLIMQRSHDKLDVYRLILLPQASPVFSQLNRFMQDRNWGGLYLEKPPLTQAELIRANEAMLEEVARPFVAIRPVIPRTTSTCNKIARETVFRETLLSQYERRCAVSGISLTAYNISEVQAAHVVGLARGGADEPRNGITLTSTLHWAFDKGLFGVTNDRRVIVPQRVLNMPENAWLRQFNNSPILEARNTALRTAAEAFSWHREHFLAQWN